MPINRNGYTPETAAQSAAYLLLKAARPLAKDHLAHLLYLAERHHAKTRFYAIFNDRWQASPHGPYCHHAATGLNGKSDFPIWNALLRLQLDGLVCCRENVTFDQLDQLSDAIVTCDAIIAEFGDLTEPELCAWMRANLPENNIDGVIWDHYEITAHAMALSIGFDDPDYFVEIDAANRRFRTFFANLEESPPRIATHEPGTNARSIRWLAMIDEHIRRCNIQDQSVLADVAVDAPNSAAFLHELDNLIRNRVLAIVQSIGKDR